jgi:hypothetical protein
MKNMIRRFSQNEYELLLRALATHQEYMKHLISGENLAAPMDQLFPGMSAKVREAWEADALAGSALRERISGLYHHDIDWIGDGSPKWCLVCSRRHEPHCSNCAGCLPEELPE